MYIYLSFLIHLSAKGHLGCFHVLTIVNSASINNEVHMSVSILVSSVFMSYGNSISSFFFRNLHTVLGSGCTSLHSVKELVSSLHQVAKALDFQLQHQSFHVYSGLISLRIDWFDFLADLGTLQSIYVYESIFVVLMLPSHGEIEEC